jgi:putative membrane protein
VTTEQKTANEMAAERTELAEERTGLASKRTLMAADRTLMAWVRTGLSMISFGFTIYKMLQAFQGGGAAAVDYSPRRIGLFLTGLGTVSIVVGTVEYWQVLKDMGGHKAHVWRPAFVMAVLFSAAGLFMFVSLIYRLF